jgi:hypothetical protein
MAASVMGYPRRSRPGSEHPGGDSPGVWDLTETAGGTGPKKLRAAVRWHDRPDLDHEIQPQHRHGRCHE